MLCTNNSVIQLGMNLHGGGTDRSLVLDNGGVDLRLLVGGPGDVHPKLKEREEGCLLF